MSISDSAKQLYLPFIRSNADEFIREAEIKGLTMKEFLEELLQHEVELRNENGIQRRIKAAHFPSSITFDEYQRDHLSLEIRQKIRQLEDMRFVDNNENIILIGNPGTGKTALSVAIGMKACRMKKNVLFINIPSLIIEINEAMSRNEISLYKKRFERYDLVILDELGYCTFDQTTGEVLFNLLSSRNEHGSIIITSNLTFDKWNEVFRDKVLTGAIVDRLAYKAHMIDMSGDSYRIISTRKWQENN